ncbi:bile acid:sodium symporter family protein [Planctomicrobium piriforme]|uniref:Solute carrier family 10 (Sodium/bile acid cotransporter), member 7 n=1 Tax=Planctomicrobium piriforme TaxID=1576369 RepID=A0A1I3BIC9_9PLAN|nr:bile acid:sodium symporter [Planctomicrobium piriforme]SFH62012.1 solute carrier family 10 (sodium/bile acid cotransporter), member 7 [Planctomicrobium piriforme]
MANFLRRRWFLIAILLVIPLGLKVGFRARPDTVSHFPKELVQIASGFMTALILFLMSVTLENRKLRESLRAPGPVLWGSVVNFLVIPLLALAMLPFQRQSDLAIGLMVAASVPSTLAAASVWTRKAGGNDAISLLITVLTNGACFVITPMWMQLGLGDKIQLNTGELVVQLFATALLPILVGQSFRAWPWFRQFADRSKQGFGALAQVCILLIVFWASVQSGVRLNASQAGGGGFAGGPALIVWASCILLHLLGLLIAIAGGRAFRFPREDIVGSAFAASQKTLPIGLFVAASVAGSDAPFTMVPILMFHASQLVLDTLIADPLQKWVTVGAEASAQGDSTTESTENTEV